MFVVVVRKDLVAGGGRWRKKERGPREKKGGLEEGGGGSGLSFFTRGPCEILDDSRVGQEGKTGKEVPNMRGRKDERRDD